MVKKLFQKELITLNNLSLKNTAENLIDTFIKAGKIAKDIGYRGVKITIKADKSPVTDGDLAVNELLTNKIKDLTPNIPVVSEEAANLNRLYITTFKDIK